MKPKTNNQPTPPPRWETERLMRWLFEWNLMQTGAKAADAEQDDASIALSHTLPTNTVAPPDPTIEAGDIRLLVPRANEGPVFFAVAHLDNDDNVVCVPFSPLSEPATPDELLSGRDTPVVRVFALWNTRTLPPHQLRESWIADCLSPSELDRLRQALHGCLTHGAVPAPLRRDAGPSLSHPEDPRRRYRYQERQRIDLALAHQDTHHNTIEYKIPPPPQELPKAAEDHDKYGEKE